LLISGHRHLGKRPNPGKTHANSGALIRLG
jgi:hypothetical protein